MADITLNSYYINCISNTITCG